MQYFAQKRVAMTKLRDFLRYGLLAFVLISIGFALGKHSVRSSRSPADQPAAQGDYVAVYYLHSTFRCVTCNTIEKMTRELLNTVYSKEVSEKKILWFEQDFQENEALAKQFEVVASCVVVAKMKDGKLIDYQRLDDVWTLMKDPVAFNHYISGAINGYLKTSGDKS